MGPPLKTDKKQQESKDSQRDQAIALLRRLVVPSVSGEQLQTILKHTKAVLLAITKVRVLKPKELEVSYEPLLGQSPLICSVICTQIMSAQATS